MCLGAAMQCGVDTVIFGMYCKPDGASHEADNISLPGQSVPEIIAGVLENECVKTFRTWDQPIDHPAYPYVQAILEHYNK